MGAGSTTLRQVYIVRDSLRAARSPFMSGGEIDAALAAKSTKSNSPTSQALGGGSNNAGQVASHEKRWERVQRALSDLEVEVLEAEVLWGAEAQQAVAPLRKAAGEFYANLVQYVRWRSGQFDPPPQYADKLEKVVFSIPDDDGKDAFSAELDEAIRTAERFARPHLKR